MRDDNGIKNKLKMAYQGEESMNYMNDLERVKSQYEKPDNLDIRMLLHTRYSINQQPFADWIFEQYQLYQGCHIFELGCGNGDLWKEHITNLGKDTKLILSDFSEGMVKQVKERYQGHPNVTFEQINIEELPYPEATFDIVIANMMLYHVPDLEKALSEAARVLKPGGTFYAATVGENGIYQYLEAAINDAGFCWNQTQSFTLQNGEARLREYFNQIEMRERIDRLEVTDTNDLLDYIYSMKDIMQVEEQDRLRLYEVFENKKDNMGIIHIPKEYGMFVAKK